MMSGACMSTALRTFLLICVLPLPYNAATCAEESAVTDLILITDISRLMQVFSRLEETGAYRVRVASSLDAAGAEITREKPAAVFIQTHLSGFSADILLMHLKKLLGRKRTRFILLASPAEAGSEGAKLFQGFVDSSLDDAALLDAVRSTLNEVLSPPRKPRVSSPLQDDEDSADVPVVEQPVPPPSPAEAGALVSLSSSRPESDSPPAGESLEEQGVTYAPPRSRLKVYSEFTSSFDEAVSTIQAIDEPREEIPERPVLVSDSTLIETVEAPAARPKVLTFLLWSAPVLVAALVVTFMQHRAGDTQKPAVAPPALVTPAQVKPTVPASGTAPAPPSVAAPVPPTVLPAAAPQPLKTTVPPPPPVANTPQPATADTRLSDKAVLSAIAENREKPAAARQSASSARLTTLPDFIPRYGFDKQYGQSNPGWERYKGQVTEFKVLREAGGIKAIQVIDRGGQGVPESFMKGVVRQVAKKPSFVQESSERKDGYEIQRGRLADGLDVIFYRDEEGGRLRAFSLVWK